MCWWYKFILISVILTHPTLVDPFLPLGCSWNNGRMFVELFDWCCCSYCLEWPVLLIPLYSIQQIPTYYNTNLQMKACMDYNNWMCPLIIKFDVKFELYDSIIWGESQSMQEFLFPISICSIVKLTIFKVLSNLAWRFCV